MDSFFSGRERMVLVMTIVAVACVLIDRAITFRMKYIQTLDRKIAQSRAELVLGQKLLKARGDIARTELELGLKLVEGRELQNVPAFLAKLDQEARSAGIAVVSMRPGPDGFGAVMSLVGDWNALVKFLSAVQARPYLLDIRSLGVESKASQDKTLQIECVLGPPQPPGLGRRGGKPL